MASKAPFTSQLSVDGFALCGPSGIVPIKQVMGSCVFYLGRSSLRAYGQLYGPSAARRRAEHDRAHGVELDGVTAGFNDAREQALGRLRSEALACGAHAVLDVRMQRTRLDSPAQSVEYVITGTAVRLGDARPPSEPSLIALPVDDYWKLVQAGHNAVGITATTVVYQTRPSLDAARALAGLRYRRGREICEIPEFSATVSGVVEIALARMGQSAQRRRADHIVGVVIERRLEAIIMENDGRTSVAREPSKRKHLRVTVHALATAIHSDGAHGIRERTEHGTWRDVGPAQSSLRTTIESVIDLGSRPKASSKPETVWGEIHKGGRDARRTT